MDYKLLVIVSSKSNPLYLKLKDLLTEPIVKELESRKIAISENIIDDCKQFIIYLYAPSMQLIESLNTVDNNTIRDIIKAYDDFDEKYKKEQTGGRVSYKHRYEKYKSKYNMMKGVITKYV